MLIFLENTSQLQYLNDLFRGGIGFGETRFHIGIIKNDPPI